MTKTPEMLLNKNTTEWYNKYKNQMKWIRTANKNILAINLANNKFVKEISAEAKSVCLIDRVFPFRQDYKLTADTNAMMKFINEYMKDNNIKKCDLILVDDYFGEDIVRFSDCILEIGKKIVEC